MSCIMISVILQTLIRGVANYVGSCYLRISSSKASNERSRKHDHECKNYG